MPVFSYRAFTSSGSATSGMLDADSAVAARARLREMGLVPTEVAEAVVAASTDRRSPFERFFAPRIPERELALFTRQMAVLLAAGMPLVEGLEAVMEQIDNAQLGGVVLRLKEDVSQGKSYSDALGRYPRWFSKMYVNMVRAGEAAGALDTVLDRLADYQDRRVKVQRRVRAAVTYPIVMSTVGFAVLVFLMTYIVPNVTRIFLELERDLPLPTRILLAVSGFVHAWWWAMIPAAIGGGFLLRGYLRTDAGRALWDTVRLRLPIIRRLTLSLVISRFTRTLGTLLASGVPLLEAMNIVRSVVNHTRFEQAIEQAQAGVRKGDDLAGALRRSASFPPMVLHMIALGERSAELEQMLMRAAETAEDELEADLTALVSLLEPAMIILMGAAVGFIVLAILLPIFDLNAQFG